MEGKGTSDESTKTTPEEDKHQQRIQIGSFFFIFLAAQSKQSQKKAPGLDEFPLLDDVLLFENAAP